MPLFEDDTLKGAIQKAVQGLRPKADPYGSYGAQDSSVADEISTLIPLREERFNNQSLGSCIAGSGRSGFANLSGAIGAASQQMENLARAHYRDRFDRILAGQRHAQVMIPELAAAIELQVSASGSETYSFSCIRAGSRFSDGSGRFAVPYSSDLAAIVHSHWIENLASDDDDGQKIRTLNHARGDSERIHVKPEEIEFWVYSPLTGLRQY